jgi:hypothetical protein
MLHERLMLCSSRVSIDVGLFAELGHCGAQGFPFSFPRSPVSSVPISFRRPCSPGLPCMSAPTSSMAALCRVWCAWHRGEVLQCGLVRLEPLARVKHVVSNGVQYTMVYNTPCCNQCNLLRGLLLQDYIWM